MPLLLVTLLFLASVVLLVVRRGREELLVCAMFGSLVIYWLGILIFIAKRGGTGGVLESLLFVCAPLKNALRGASLGGPPARGGRPAGRARRCPSGGAGARPA